MIKFEAVFGDKFYFARHGETDYNNSGMVTGGSDIPLNSNGILQAKKANDIVKTLGIKACVASPLDRCIQTATLMLNGVDVQINTHSGLKERFWGELEGKKKAELDNFDFEKAKVERWEDFVKRVALSLNELKQDTQPTIIVAHSGTYRVICELMEIVQIKKPVENATPYIFYKTGGKWSVELVR